MDIIISFDYLTVELFFNLTGQGKKLEIQLPSGPVHFNF